MTQTLMQMMENIFSATDTTLYVDSDISTSYTRPARVSGETTDRPRAAHAPKGRGTGPLCPTLTPTIPKRKIRTPTIRRPTAMRFHAILMFSLTLVTLCTGMQDESLDLKYLNGDMVLVLHWKSHWTKEVTVLKRHPTVHTPSSGNSMIMTPIEDILEQGKHKDGQWFNTHAYKPLNYDMKKYNHVYENIIFGLEYKENGEHDYRIVVHTKENGKVLEYSSTVNYNEHLPLKVVTESNIDDLSEFFEEQRDKFHWVFTGNMYEKIKNLVGDNERAHPETRSTFWAQVYRFALARKTAQARKAQGSTLDQFDAVRALVDRLDGGTPKQN